MNSVWDLFLVPKKPDDGSKESSTGSATPKASAKKPTVPVVVGSLSQPTAMPVAVSQAVDPDMMAKLKTAMLSDGNNAVDRFEAVFVSLDGIVPDANDMRFLAAIKSAASQGLKPDDVLADVLSDEQILTQKEAEFAQVVAQQRDSALGGKQTQMEAAATEIAKKRAEIVAAQAAITKLEADQTALQEQAASEARKIAGIEARFSVTLGAIRASREELKQKLQPHCTRKGS